MFQGNLLDCLAHFRRQVPDPIGSISQFCAVSDDTASRWNIKRLPKGSALNRIWVLLSEHDLVVLEFADQTPIIKYLNQLLAFEVINMAELKLVLGVTADDQYAWRVLQGKVTPNSIRSKKVTLANLRSKYDADLQAAREMACEAGIIVPAKQPARASASTDAATPAPPPQAPTPDRTQGISLDLSVAALLAASNLMAAFPAVLQLVEAGPEGQDLLKKTMGEQRFYDLLNALKSLSSRQSLKFFRGEQQS